MFKVNNKDIGVVLVTLLLTLNMYVAPRFSVSIVNFERVIVGWVWGFQMFSWCIEKYNWKQMG